MRHERIERLVSIRDDKPFVIAHRGLAHLFPPNTLPSFVGAIAAKADMVELDFHVTADEKLVCVHDGAMRRYLDPTQYSAEVLDRPISMTTLAQLREFDVGIKVDARFKGTTVPTLDDTIDCCRDTVLLIERKTGTPEQTLALLDRHAAADRVIVQAFDMAYLKALHALAPRIVLAALDGGTPEKPINLDKFREVGASAIHWGDCLRKADIDAMHAGGFPVWMYTLNSEIAWRGAVELGIDGITTDYCDVIREVVT